MTVDATATIEMGFLIVKKLLFKYIAAWKNNDDNCKNVDSKKKSRNHKFEIFMSLRFLNENLFFI